MTRSEALAYFKEELKDGKCSDTCPICNANEWAIKALEEPQIVRCKDCIYLRESDPLHPDTEWCQRLICGTVNPEFFCADGRRKENK